jgi:hypothetical protein
LPAHGQFTAEDDRPPNNPAAIVFALRGAHSPAAQRQAKQRAQRRARGKTTGSTALRKSASHRPPKEWSPERGTPNKRARAKEHDPLTIERLERTLALCARMVVADGPILIPLFESMKRDLAAMRAEQDGHRVLRIGKVPRWHENPARSVE